MRTLKSFLIGAIVLLIGFLLSYGFICLLTDYGIFILSLVGAIIFIVISVFIGDTFLNQEEL